MPALLPKIDGLSFILFHVEHSQGESWQYRWRIVGDYPPAYLVWREATITESRAKVVTEIRGCAVECQWRADPADEWGQVALLVLGTPTARFSIHAEREFAAPGKFTIVSAVRDDGVAAYEFPAMHLNAGVNAGATAHADAPAVANLLLAAGEFAPRLDGLRITNLGPCENGWQVLPHAGPFPLVRCPVAAARRWFAVGTAPVDPALLPS